MTMKNKLLLGLGVCFAFLFSFWIIKPELSFAFSCPEAQSCEGLATTCETACAGIPGGTCVLVDTCAASPIQCAYVYDCIPPTITCPGGASPGDTQSCTSDPNTCGDTNPGTQTCQSDGTWSSCSASPPPTPSPTTCPNICGDSATATCGDTCVPPALPSGYGTSCGGGTSPVNSCKQTQPCPTGTIQCDGSCNAATCTAPPDPSGYGSACNDGNGCTSGETIQCDGSCGGGTVSGTHKACNSVTGTCSVIVDNTSSSCTGCTTDTECGPINCSTRCTAWLAIGECGTTTTCGAGNQFWSRSCGAWAGTCPETQCTPCSTTDYCPGGDYSGNPTDGTCCVSGVGSSCSDGNACTTGETIQCNGTCSGGSSVNCNDSNSCTTDSCNSSTGCVHSPVSGSHLSCSGSSCVSTSNSSSSCTNSCATSADCGGTPTPTPTCAPASFVGGSASPSSVNAGGAYTILCDYGVYTNAINPVPGSGSCVWSGTWVGTAAKFNCTAGTATGTFSNSCRLSNISPDYYCSRTDAINSLTVVTSGTAVCDSTWRLIPGRPQIVVPPWAPIPVNPTGNPVIDFLPAGYYAQAPSYNAIGVAQAGSTGGMSWDDLYDRMSTQGCAFTSGINNMCVWSSGWGVSLVSYGKTWQDWWAQWRTPWPGIHSDTTPPNNWNVYSPMTNCGSAGVNCTYKWSTNIGDVSKPWGTPISHNDPAGRTWEVRRNGADYEYRCTAPLPTVSLLGSPNPVTYNTASTLSWSSTNATRCTASIDWSGSKATSGSESTGALTSAKTYTLTCTGDGGSTSSTVTINITNGPPTVPSVTVTESDYCTSLGAYVNWTYSDPEGDLQSAYQVQINAGGSSWNPPLTVDTGKVSGSGTSYFASGLPFDKTLKARVRVWDSHDNVSGWKESGSWKTPKHAYPYVDFIYSPSDDIPAKQPVQFTDQTTFYDGSEDKYRSWSWLFGDGGTSTQKSPSHTYNLPGIYSVSLTATDKDNFSCSRTKPITIAQPVPVWKEVSPK